MANSDDFKAPRAPNGVCYEAKKLWSKIVELYELGPADLEILKEACHALTRAVDARETIEEEGAYFLDRFNNKKAHPAVLVEHNSRLSFNKLIQSLYLDDPDGDD